MIGELEQMVKVQIFMSNKILFDKNTEEYKSHSVGGWVDGDLLDTADSLSGGLLGDLDVSSISPAGSP